jgi:hypothetical protein
MTSLNDTDVTSLLNNSIDIDFGFDDDINSILLYEVGTNDRELHHTQLCESCYFKIK